MYEHVVQRVGRTDLSLSHMMKVSAAIGRYLQLLCRMLVAILYDWHKMCNLFIWVARQPNILKCRDAGIRHNVLYNLFISGHSPYKHVVAYNTSFFHITAQLSNAAATSA